MFFRRVAVVVGLVCALVCVNVGGVRADDVITTQPFVDYYGVRKAHEKGFAGQGVTIAIIDSAIDTSVPELQGVEIETISECPITLDLENDLHGTAIASALASPAYGWVPKAKFISIPVAGTISDDAESHELDSCRYDVTGALAKAITLNPDFITVAATFAESGANQFLVNEAVKRGIVIVATAGNNGSTGVAPTPNNVNGVVSVGSHSLDNRPSPFSTSGKGLTLLALGEELTIRDVDEAGRLTRIDPYSQGTSWAAPMVTGALALGKSKWPHASNHQILRAMISTANACVTDTNRSVCGYGLMNVGPYWKSDPTQFEDSNPLMDKNPFLAELAQGVEHDYATGLKFQYAYDDMYIYRGSEHAPLLYKQGRNPQPRFQFASSPVYMKNVAAYEASQGLIPTDSPQSH